MSEPVKTAPIDALVLAAVACGGGLGAGLRYWLTLGIPVRPGTIPWPTFLANTLGCLAIGVLMVIITEVWTPHRLMRPFLGVGVLGGFTTFSSYSAEVRTLLESGATGVGLGYLGEPWWPAWRRSSRERRGPDGSREDAAGQRSTARAERKTGRARGVG